MVQKEPGMEQFKERLLELGQKFIGFYREGEYSKAKQCYDTALTVVCFIGFPEEDREELFGNREKEIIGAFPENIVQKVFFYTCVKGNEDRRFEDFEENEIKHAQRQAIGIYAKK